MRPGTWRRPGLPILAAALLIAATALTACAAPGAAHSTRAAHAAHSTRGAGTSVVAASRVKRAARADACDPTASLRPAGPPAVTPGSYMAKIRARGFLIAGVDQSTFHFGYLNPLDGKIEGFDIDMIRDIAQAIFGNPNKVEYKAISDAQRIPEVQSGAVDIVAHTMTITCDRLTQVDFSTVYFEAGQRVLVPTNSPVTSLADLGRKKVCATTGSTSIENLKAAPSHPIPVAVPYWTDCLVLLQQGGVAAISTDDSILAGLAAQDPFTRIVGPKFTKEPYGLAISKQNPDFVRFVNAVLQRVRTDGQWTASYQHWVGSPAAAPPAARYLP
ncbi:MAG TPA: glutamate ABC transporter substrate-binding protein [Streptosporangiaceae bacterium]|nr:glutamate ABC transporter substrate-binding protein [Streptosporangiaceae bacterium]